jgi:hypothetical protein
MECTIDNVFNLRDLALQELVKIIVVCYIKNLRLKFKCGILQHFICTISIKKALQTYKVKLTGSVMEVYSGWDSFLLKYGGEVFLDEVTSI